MIIDHIDTNKLNNNITNLRQVKDAKENLNNEITRLNLSKAVKQYDLDGNFIASYSSCKEAAESVGVNKPVHCSHISSVCKGKMKSFKGYLWCYEGQEDTIPDKVTKLNKNKGPN